MHISLFRKVFIPTYRFNVTASLQLVDRFLLIPGSLSSAKYAREGELFAHLKFEDVLSEDSVAGRLILQNCQTAWLAPASDNFEANQEKPCKASLYCFHFKMHKEHFKA